jgi:hypothetical protein
MDMNRKSDSRTDMHRNFSMSGSGTRGSETGRGRIGAEEDDIRTEHTTEDEAGDDTRTINDMAAEALENGEQIFDTGTGTGDNDYIGRTTGNEVDDSIADTVAGGTTSGRTAAGASADNATGGDSGKGDLGTTGSIDHANQAEAPTEGGPVSTTLSGESATLSDEDRSAGRTGGSGAYTNDDGSRLDDIPTGTGSAQRGNRAGMEDNDEGTIIEG